MIFGDDEYPALMSATFSKDLRFRYSLSRGWSAEDWRVAFIGLNPSTADATKDDPTIRRCIGFAKSWGFGTLHMLNLFAVRSTDPKVLYRMSNKEAIGDENDAKILEYCNTVSLIVCAWGTHGALHGRGEQVAKMLRANGLRLSALGFTKDGYPRHPLYLGKHLTPGLWTP